MAKEKKPTTATVKLPLRKPQPKQSKPLFDFSDLLDANQEKLFKYAFIIVAALIFVIRPIFSSHFGPSGDELTHKALGDLSYDYITSFGHNDSLFRFDPTAGREDASLLQNYGPLLEVTSAAIYKNFHTNPYQTRHLIITLFTFLLFYYCGMAAYKIGGWRAGLIAMLFMLVSPRILGESFNNPKDPPFAAGYMMAVYGLLCLVSELPKPSWRTTLLTMLGIGLAFSVRVGGLLLFPYTLLFIAIGLALRYGSNAQVYFAAASVAGLALYKLLSLTFSIPISATSSLIVFLIILTRGEEWRKYLLSSDFGVLALKVIVIFAGAWFIAIICWPAGLRHPFTQPFHALAVQSSYPTVISVLFDGKVIGSNEVPWSYNPFYITNTSPIIVIIGFFIGLALLPWLRKTFNGYYLFMVLFVSIFPLFWIIYQKSALLNGWRHSYFTYTGIAVFAAVTFEGLFRLVKPKALNYILYGVLAVGLLLPSIFIVKNFPVIYVYFNELAGGVDGTYGDYNLDYYACSAKPAADWMAKNIPYDSTKIVMSNNPGELNESWGMDNSKWKSTYIRYRERNEKDWDYAIFLPQFVDPQMMKKGLFAPKGTIHKVMVDNSVVACIVKRESKDDVIGIEALKKNDIQTALPHLEAAVNADPNNEIALAYLGIAYAMTGHRTEGINALSRSMNISPGYQLPQVYMERIQQSQQ